VEKHLYFINPAIDALPEATGEERRALVKRIAACVGDESALRAILGIDPEEFAHFYPDMLPPELSTDDTISSFISRFSSQQAADTPEVEEIIAAPSIDYASMLEAENPTDHSQSLTETPAETDKTDSIISNFLKAVPPKRPAPRKLMPAPRPATAPEANVSQNQGNVPTSHTQDDSLSEALFKLMVKNKNYAKALEIITELSLNNPKKSIYFAYQMRFLKKLIKYQDKQSNLTKNPGNQ